MRLQCVAQHFIRGSSEGSLIIAPTAIFIRRAVLRASCPPSPLRDLTLLDPGLLTLGSSSLSLPSPLRLWKAGLQSSSPIVQGGAFKDQP